MGKEITTLIIDVIIALWGLFVTAPMISNAIGQFTVQQKLLDKVISKGIITGDNIKVANDFLKSKKTGGIFVGAIVLIVLVLVCIKNAPYSYICGVVGLALGFFKYRKAMQYNTLAVKNFKRAYDAVIDKEKFASFEKEEFGKIS